MKRIMIMGCCGSGKSTLSKVLGEILNIKVIHLDQHYWQANWTEMDKTEWTKTVERLVEDSEWIIDGNYSGTMDIRTVKADTIIYLDYPSYKCLWRITKRIYNYHGKVRPDMPPGCPERFDLEFYHYVLSFNILRRHHILNKLERLNGKKQIEILKNDTDIQRFVRQIKTAS